MTRKRKYSEGDLVGKNNVKLIRYVEKNKYRQWKCEFQCTECENTFIVGLNAVSSGNSHLCEQCKRIASQKRGQKVGKLSTHKDYSKKDNPFYSFVSPLNKYDKEGIQYWIIKCKKCGQMYEERPVYLISETRRKGNNPCSCWKRSRESKGSLLIKQILQENNINFIQEYYFADCLSTKNKYLYFDFYLPDYNCCIEYDGEQHFKPVEHFGGQEQYKRQQLSDDIKNNYCKNNNIKLIRIPYTDYNKISLKYLTNKGVFSG